MAKLVSYFVCQFLWPEKIWEDGENYFLQKNQAYVQSQRSLIAHSVPISKSFLIDVLDKLV